MASQTVVYCTLTLDAHGEVAGDLGNPVAVDGDYRHFQFSAGFVGHRNVWLVVGTDTISWEVRTLLVPEPSTWCISCLGERLVRENTILPPQQGCLRGIGTPTCADCRDCENGEVCLRAIGAPAPGCEGCRIGDILDVCEPPKKLNGM